MRRRTLKADKVLRVRTPHFLGECLIEISSVVKTSGAEEQTATIFGALELSKNRWLVAVRSPIDARRVP